MQEVKFMVKSRSKFLKCALTSCPQVVLDSDELTGSMGSWEHFGVGGGRCTHGKGPALLCEHKDQKSTEENEQEGREENVGT